LAPRIAILVIFRLRLDVLHPEYGLPECEWKLTIDGVLIFKNE